MSQRKATSGKSKGESYQQALERARSHAGRAVAESLRALDALIDAGSLAASGRPGADQPWTRSLGGSLRELAQMIEGERASGALLDAVAQALDAEVGRWETRAAQDPDARAVLRAYLGVRELLWEMGVRPAPGGAASGPSGAPESEPRRPKRPRGASRPRSAPVVERIRVEG